MGAHAYYYGVPYRDDTQAALEALRQREFRAGRYSPVLRHVKFGAHLLDQNPGAQHESIEEALRASAEAGTRSILDIDRVGPRADYGVASPLDTNLVRGLCGTDRPTRDNVFRELWNELCATPRGHARYLTIYDGETPRELFFMGYSLD